MPEWWGVYPAIAALTILFCLFVAAMTWFVTYSYVKRIEDAQRRSFLIWVCVVASISTGLAHFFKEYLQLRGWLAGNLSIIIFFAWLILFHFLSKTARR